MRPRQAALAAALGLMASAGQAQQVVTSLGGGKQHERLAVGTAGTTTMNLAAPLTDIDPDAVCNDGSSGVYYFAQGSSQDYIVFLEGGFWCFDESSCKTRFESAPFAMSSGNSPTQIAEGGILGTDPKNPWLNANKIMVKTCSSDAFLGDAPASADTWGYAFRGSRIVAAVATALLERHGLGKQGDRLLLAGCSSGGQGVMANLDAVAALMPAAVDFKGFVDAAAWADVQPPDANLVSLQDMTQDIAAFAQPPIPEECAKAYSGQEWKCLWGQYRMPFIKTPFYLNEAQFDSFEIMYDLEDAFPTTLAEKQWASTLQKKTLNIFKSLNPNIATIFSPTCLVHCLSTSNPNYLEFEVNGQTMAQAMGEWYNGNAHDVISSCQGYGCTQQCSGGPWQPTNTAQSPSTAPQNGGQGAAADNILAVATQRAGNEAWAAQQGKIVWAKQQAAEKAAATGGTSGPTGGAPGQAGGTQSQAGGTQQQQQQAQQALQQAEQQAQQAAQNGQAMPKNVYDVDPDLSATQAQALALFMENQLKNN